MKATIKDVASKAGVAVSTVSRVINGKNRVSADTEKKVNDAIKELGYIKNNLAASIKSDKSHFVAVVVPDIRNEFYTAVIRGAESILSKEGYYTLVYTTKEVIENEETVFEGPVGQMVDGIILIPAQKDCRQYKKYGKPVVFIDRDLPDGNFCSVTVDNYNGVAILTEELIKNGHTKIAILSGPQDFNIGYDRMNAYQNIMRKHNIPLREEYICTKDWFEEDGYNLTSKLLKLSDPPTAILATNNLICIGSAECLYDNGYRIGKDISLAGFDDSTMAKYMGNGITCIKRATNQMGEEGAKILLSLIREKREEIAKNKLVLDVELVRRNSIAKIN